MNNKTSFQQTVILSNKSHSAGFTILELMIAAAVFAVVLLIVAIGAISFTNSYYSGITSSDVQSVSRAIMSEVSQSLEFSQNFAQLTLTSGVAGYCIDNTMYTYKLGFEVVSSTPFGPDQGYHGLVLDTNSSCSPSTTPTLPATQSLSSSQHELLNQHMRITAFDITQLSSNIYTVHIKVDYGDDSILKSPLPAPGSILWSGVSCNSGAGSQFCATSDLTTSVEQRLN